MPASLIIETGRYTYANYLPYAGKKSAQIKLDKFKGKFTEITDIVAGIEGMRIASVGYNAEEEKGRNNPLVPNENDVMSSDTEFSVRGHVLDDKLSCVVEIVVTRGYLQNITFTYIIIGH